MTRRKPGDVQGHLSLATVGLSSSFGLTALRSVLESQGCGRLPALTPTMTVDALADLVGGAPPAAVPAAVSPPPAAQASAAAPVGSRPPVPATPRPAASAMPVGLGMDMQEIATFPAADDFREHPFYAGAFTPQELATAVLRPNPRAHLCGLFCAKEAAKKSHPALLDVRMSDLCVLPDEAGRPVLRVADGLAAGLRFLVSITHTDTVAAATCVVLSE
jgi:holo-[acyl-carrier protein] synthase